LDALGREISDHTPLLRSTGERPKAGNQPPFRFEVGWLLRDEFFELVSNVWNKETRGEMPMKKWQNKIRRLRKFVRSWAKNLSGAYKKEEHKLMRKIYELDKKSGDPTAMLV
jgi:predicted secreted Zn-dependent protease